MSRIVLALDAARTDALRDDLALTGQQIVREVAPGELARAVRTWDAENDSPLRDVDAIVVPAERALLSSPVLAACDRAGVRILLLGDEGDGVHLASRHGLAAPLPADASAWRIADALAAPHGSAVPPEGHAGTGGAFEPGRVVAVWGPHGAPGRTTIAIELAAALTRSGPVSLVDADTHAPAVALLLGLGDDGPGLAAACRRAETGGLDDSELTRLSRTVDTSQGPLEVLTGLNRPARWPELTPGRLRGALDACRGWTRTTVVDVAAALEADEELMSDLSVPRRNAAARTALESADHIVAVASADALGLARFVRAYSELRALVGTTPVTVVVNRVRSGSLGIDARGQIRRALDRFSGIGDIRFLPDDPRALDAALLHARPVAEVSPRSAFAAAIRQLSTMLDRTGRAAVTGEPDTQPERRALRRRDRRVVA